MLMALIKPLKNLMGSQRKKVIIYLLCSILFFALTSVLTFEKIIDGSLLSNFILMQIIIFIFGIIHLYAMETFFEWPEEKKNISQLAFSFVVTIFGSAGFLFIAIKWGTPTFSFFFWSTFLSFFIGYFIRLIWQNTVQFPEPVFIKWYYPISRVVSNPGPDELRNPRIISLILLKSTKSATSTVFKAKAPEHMTFDKFFFHFINDYNLRTPESLIEVKDSSNQPFGWYFYTKPNFFGLSRNVSPHLTIHANGIKEHTAIVCKRAL
jgi:hypothetical protein